MNTEYEKCEMLNNTYIVVHCTFFVNLVQPDEVKSQKCHCWWHWNRHSTGIQMYQKHHWYQLYEAQHYLVIAQLVKKSPAFYWILRFITVFTKAHQWTQSWEKKSRECAWSQTINYPESDAAPSHHHTVCLYDLPCRHSSHTLWWWLVNHQSTPKLEDNPCI